MSLHAPLSTLHPETASHARCIGMLVTPLFRILFVALGKADDKPTGSAYGQSHVCRLRPVPFAIGAILLSMWQSPRSNTAVSYRRCKSCVCCIIPKRAEPADEYAYSHADGAEEHETGIGMVMQPEYGDGATTKAY